MSKQQEQEILDDLLSGQWSAKQMVESGVLTPEEAVQRGEEAVAEATAKINKLLIEELKTIEEMTHNGRGTILWEVDTIATHIAKRLNTLQAKEVDNETTR